MDNTIPTRITVQGNSGAKYKLYQSKSGEFFMVYPKVDKHKRVVVNTTLTKPITKDYYLKAIQYQQNIAKEES